jgi:hypothetical protein
MNRILIALVFLLWYNVPVFSQVIEGVDISKDTSVQYIMVVAGNKPFSKGIIIAIDYGQEFSWGTDSRVDDPLTGKPLKFNSVMAALNFMYSCGWEFQDAYSVTAGNANVYHYLMRRKQ